MESKPNHTHPQTREKHRGSQQLATNHYWIANEQAFLCHVRQKDQVLCLLTSEIERIHKRRQMQEQYNNLK